MRAGSQSVGAAAANDVPCSLAPDPPRPLPPSPQLPYEVIYSILELAAVSSLSAALQMITDLQPRYNVLRRAALTARAWRASAQRLLWSEVEIWEERRLQKFLEQQGLGMFTRSLRLGGPPRDWPSPGGNLCGAVGVQELDLSVSHLTR